MALIGVTESFEGKEGTAKIRDNEWICSAVLTGPLIGSFVSGVGYERLKDELGRIVHGLKGRYIDDIVGRGTIENLAMYLLYLTHNSGVQTIEVKDKSGSFTQVSVNDFSADNYGPVLIFKKGASLHVRRKYDDALVMFNEAIRINPGMAEAFNCRGRCYRYKSMPKDSLKDYTRAIILNNSFGEAYRNRGNIHLELGNLKDMMDDFNSAISLMPDSALAFNNRGFAMQRLGRYEEAILDHSRAIELDPAYREAYLDRAEAFKRIGKVESSADDEKKSLALEHIKDPYEIEWRKIVYPPQ